MKNWSPEKIRSQLALRKITQVSIARKLDVSRNHVHSVINGRKSDRVRRAIAEAIGYDVREIWPEDYLVDALVA